MQVAQPKPKPNLKLADLKNGDRLVQIAPLDADRGNQNHVGGVCVVKHGTLVYVTGGARSLFYFSDEDMKCFARAPAPAPAE